LKIAFMSSRPIIPHCQLIDIIGKPRSMNGTLFVPALLDIVRPASTSFWLDDFFPDAFPYGDSVRSRDSRIWTRIADAFEFRPWLCFDDDSEALRPPINVGIVAVTGSETVPLVRAWPFVCHSQVTNSDTYGDPFIKSLGLVFSSDGPQTEIKQRIAEAFWSLLSSTPDEGLNCYEAFSQEAFNIPDQCPECGGTGLEGTSLFRLREPCETCHGVGTVTWREDNVDQNGLPIGDDFDWLYACGPGDIDASHY
jgi:hypothetical protein